MQKYSIGSDPEFFIASLTGKKKIVSSIPVLGGSKDEKINLGDGYAVFPDNVLCEGSIPPGNTTKQTVHNVGELIGRINELLGPKDKTILAQASHEFPKYQLKSKAARLAGCSPEYCIHAMAELPPPQLGKTQLRTGGGHIHVGAQGYKTTKNPFLLEFPTKMAGVKAMDYIVGVTETWMNNDPTAPRRKVLYGKAGRHRAENLPYGFEYRTPSSFWVSRPQLVEFFDALTRYAMDVCQKDPDQFHNNSFEAGYDINAARTIIDENDVEAAAKYLKEVLPSEFYDRGLELKQLPYSPVLAQNWK